MLTQPGPIVLFGSGETSTTGRTVFEWLLRQLPPSPRIAILETPAGFQPNSALVAQEIADFLAHRLRNFHPDTVVVPARKRGTPLSPDEPEVVAPLCRADAIFLGPGSPTYAASQLRNSLAWEFLLGRHLQGAAVIFASAAAIAAGACTLPVYEIYKVGTALHWQAGLDFFSVYGLALTIIPHWNNREGGEKLDTSHCFMGRERFDELVGLLPPGVLCVGIDEHTALVMQPSTGVGLVQGRGTVTLLQDGTPRVLPNESSFPLAELGAFRSPTTGNGLPSDAWGSLETPEPATAGPPVEVAEWVAEREAARMIHDWAVADGLRRRIQAHGWQVRDTCAGPELAPLGDRA